MKVLKKIRIGIILMIIGISVFYACKKDVVDINNVHLAKQKSGDKPDETEETFEKACREFYENIPSAFDAKHLDELIASRGWITDVTKLPPPPKDADSVSYDIVYSDIVNHSELDPKEYQMQEQIQAMAWQAMMTGEDEELMQYLRQYGLDNKYLEIGNKYNLKSKSSGGSGSGEDNIPNDVFKNTSLMNGDIFLKYDISSSGSSNGSSSGSNILNWLIPGKWGHAAYMDIQRRSWGDNYYLLSSSNETDKYDANPSGVIGRNGYDKIVGYWTTATQVAVCRVNNANTSQRRASLDYIINSHMGKPWSPFVSRTSNAEFYCSKVVYRGWLSQGYELEPHYSSITGLPWITIWVFDHWDYKKILFVKIYYPVFRKEIIKDLWVTPTDLDACSATYRVATY